MEFTKTIRDNSISDRTKINEYINDGKKIRPYVAIPITGRCMFNCIYCREGGEVTLGSGNETLCFDDFKFMVDCAIESGITDFRITGGEPFLNKDIIRMIEYMISKEKYLLINTCGMIVPGLFENLKEFSDCPYLDIVVSLDSLNDSNFDKITGTKSKLRRVTNAVFDLRKMGLLKRINMVITKLNCHEIGTMIRFCRRVQTNISLLESVLIPSQFGDWEEFNKPLEECRQYIEDRSEEIYIHEYTKNFGVPVLIYRVDKVFVSFKSLLGGGQYNEELCGKCEHFPCHAGLHHIKFLPDFKISVCRWKIFGNSTKEIFRECFHNALKIFENCRYMPRQTN
jgi:molybdenum cofactor biosynthesis enzyme MoaA